MRSSLCTNVNRRESSTGISTRLIGTNPNLFNLSSNTIKQASAGSAMMNATSRPAEMNPITHTPEQANKTGRPPDNCPQEIRPTSVHLDPPSACVHSKPCKAKRFKACGAPRKTKTATRTHVCSCSSRGDGAGPVVADVCWSSRPRSYSVRRKPPRTDRCATLRAASRTSTARTSAAQKTGLLRRNRRSAGSRLQKRPAGWIIALKATAARAQEAVYHDTA
ncbi:hypothetical protein B0T24DRAFT_702877 [Lasiosphaeria ovina]|uniref:Uncharacterized protein n=1 Tax=Lasiosphaeria ovina TaxID=92902 RepID=A0AAE0N756_9PEZI|nr:hypothetical protein B0T24DRAFT_702877 [Lasiosphaeria ovina]